MVMYEASSCFDLGKIVENWSGLEKEKARKQALYNLMSYVCSLFNFKCDTSD